MLKHSYNLAERYFGDMKSKIQISEVTKFKLSAETLAGLFGIHSKRKEPALFTAEVIAQYLGYHSGNQMRDEYNQQKYELLGGNN